MKTNTDDVVNALAEHLFQKHQVPASYTRTRVNEIIHQALQLEILAPTYHREVTGPLKQEDGTWKVHVSNRLSLTCGFPDELQAHVAIEQLPPKDTPKEREKTAKRRGLYKVGWKRPLKDE